MRLRGRFVTKTRWSRSTIRPDSRGLGVALLAVLLVAPAALAQSIVRGPIIQNPDALTSRMTVLWWTDVAGDSTVEYGTTPALGSSVTVPQAPSCEIGAAGTCHGVTLTGLEAGTRYYYRLLTNAVEVQSASASIYFTTLRDPGDPGDVFFTVVGDWGQASSAEQDVANLQDADDPPMILTVGDNAYQNGAQSDWDNNALAYYVNPMRRALFIPTLGNHDLNSVGPANWSSSVEIKLFQLPRNAPATQEERYFSFDDGNAHFVVLDANAAGDSTQRAWLQNDLATTPRKWKFVFLHQTPYSCANGIASIGSNSTVRTNWGPLFEYYGVDVVFDGHDHIYERSIPLDDFADPSGTPGSDGRTTIYVMSGGGGATLDDAAMVDGTGPFRKPFFFSPREDCYWLASGCPGGPSSGGGPSYCSFKRFQYTSARIVNDATLTVQAVDRSDVVFDTFSITKSAPTTTTTSSSSSTSTSSTTSSSSSTSSSTTSSTTTSTAPPTTLAPTTTSTSSSSTSTSTSTTTTSSTSTSTSTSTTSSTTTSTSSTTSSSTSTSSTSSTTTSTSTSSSTTASSSSTTSTTTSTTTTVPCLDGDGDGMCDADDDCPTVADPAQVDGDGDGLGDECDPCTNGAVVAAPRLTLSRITPPPGDDKLKVKGRMIVPTTPPFDPSVQGARLLVEDLPGGTILDVSVPPGGYDALTGIGWKVSNSGWQYRHRTGLQGITRLTVRLKPTSPGLVIFSATGRNGSFPITPSQIPPTFTLIVEGPLGLHGQCGEASFAGPVTSSCTFSSTGATLKCR